MSSSRTHARGGNDLRRAQWARAMDRRHARLPASIPRGPCSMVWWQCNREVAAGADFCRGGSVPLAEQMIDLQQWLDNIGLGQYADLFAKNDIDHEVLQELDEQDLASLGVSFGHRKKLLKATAEY